MPKSKLVVSTSEDTKDAMILELQNENRYLQELIRDLEEENRCLRNDLINLDFSFRED